MTTRELFVKTMPFCWAKLGLGLLNIVIDIVLFAIAMGISLLFKSDGVAAIMLIIWFALVGVVNFVINHYIGYMLKDNHRQSLKTKRELS